MKIKMLFECKDVVGRKSVATFITRCECVCWFNVAAVIAASTAKYNSCVCLLTFSRLCGNVCRAEIGCWFEIEVVSTPKYGGHSSYWQFDVYICCRY